VTSKIGPTEEPFDGAAFLLRPALILLLGVGGLAAFYSWGMENQLIREVSRTDLQGKAEHFTLEARRLLDGSPLDAYFHDQHQGLSTFEAMLQEPTASDEAAVFVHTKDRRKQQETLLFKGAGILQQLTVSPGRIELLEGDGSKVRRMVIQEGESPPRIVEVNRPLGEVLDQDILQEAFQAPGLRLREQIKASRLTLRRHLLLYSLAGLLLMTIVFGAMSWQMGRIRHLEKQIRRQRQLAYLGTLAGGLAHEIRNPLNGIGLNLHLLEETLEAADERLQAQSGRFLGRIHPALEHLERIVTEFLDFARPRSLDLEIFRFEELAHQVQEFLEPEARQEGKTLHLHTQSSQEGFPLNGDRERLRQVLLNLIRNALQAIGKGGNVWMELSLSSRSEVLLRVRDDGPGLPPGKEEEVFRLFYTTRDAGLGLGLPIVRRVVEDHQGSIEVEPTEGPGASFLVTLPCA
jgi:signal transduction histidine kinase